MAVLCIFALLFSLMHLPSFHINAACFHYRKQGGIELLQQPRRVAGMVSSIAGNLVRKRKKKPRSNCMSSLSATNLGSFTGMEGNILFLSLWSWYQEVHVSGRICAMQEGLGSNKGLHSSNPLFLHSLAFCPPFKEKQMFYCRECFIKSL